MSDRTEVNRSPKARYNPPPFPSVCVGPFDSDEAARAFDYSTLKNFGALCALMDRWYEEHQ